MVYFHEECAWSIVSASFPMTDTFSELKCKSYRLLNSETYLCQVFKFSIWQCLPKHCRYLYHSTSGWDKKSRLQRSCLAVRNLARKSQPQLGANLPFLPQKVSLYHWLNTTGITWLRDHNIVLITSELNGHNILSSKTSLLSDTLYNLCTVMRFDLEIRKQTTYHGVKSPASALSALRALITCCHKHLVLPQHLGPAPLLN